MSKKKLTVDTGIVTYDINGAAKVSFNPTDERFVERLYEAVAELEARQGEFRERVEELEGDGAAVFAYAAERDREMRSTIDGLLGEGVSDALFPDMNCYALADGLPVWVNLMLAVAEEVADAFEEQHGKADPRLSGYTGKYQSMLDRYKGGAKKGSK